MKFIEIEQNGKPAWVNSDNILFVVSLPTIGEAQLILVGGVAATVRGSAREIADKLNGGPGVVH